jgi:hypothetical protein
VDFPTFRWPGLPITGQKIKIRKEGKKNRSRGFFLLIYMKDGGFGMTSFSYFLILDSSLTV